MKPGEMKDRVYELMASGKMAEFILGKIETNDLVEFLSDEGIPTDEDLFIDAVETEIESRITTAFKEE